jgi:uracil-DNA glycosylase
MKDVMVIGQALGKHKGEPWESGGSARRLARWLGLADSKDIKKVAVAANVGDYAGKHAKGDKYAVNLARVRRLKKASGRMRLVFLVGRVAQRAIFRAPETALVWRRGKYIGVPHPSGVNIQLNGGKCGEVERWVRRQLRRRSS